MELARWWYALEDPHNQLTRRPGDEALPRVRLESAAAGWSPEAGWLQRTTMRQSSAGPSQLAQESGRRPCRWVRCVAGPGAWTAVVCAARMRAAAANNWLKVRDQLLACIGGEAVRRF
ncbi:hypothetical protein NDU88_003345 [Pleurodeles waltl]|uniref:Uncharacterized protein n=1 Tax=Pleurodeles waltl TaxID=8319 RepID=A0AAV7UEW7_PLEWA|nr:hypothetical protein NDU88_003345 [Pleurodeles waltl]